MKVKLPKKPAKALRQVAAVATLPKIQKILATTDFSSESLVGLRYAFALAGNLGASVALLYVVEPPSWMAGMEAVVLARADESALARAQLAKLVKREVKGDVPVTCSVRSGKPFHEITSAAREGMADLIVIATHGHTGFERLLLGSTAERVVRHAPCPVLTVPTRRQPGQVSKTSRFALKKVVVPIDFSNLSTAALPYGVLLTECHGAELLLLHIVEKFPIDYLLGRELTKETIAPVMKQAVRDLERMAGNLRKAKSGKATALVRDGTPFEEICRTAKTEGADMIVVTTHGYSGLKHVWLGSTAERVVRHAPCPVLVVRERKY